MNEIRGLSETRLHALQPDALDAEKEIESFRQCRRVATYLSKKKN
jgi:hypothetical protein